jgi:hypothetical protein
MSRYYHRSPAPLRGVASAAFALLLVFTFPVWLPLLGRLAGFVGTVLGQVIESLRY